MEMERLVVSVIDVGDRLRPVNQSKVSQIAESMEAVGLLNPITVLCPDDEKIVLVAGAHRLEAAKQLGWDEIDAVVLTGGFVDAQLAEIDENLCRHELSATEIAEHLSKRKDLWEVREQVRREEESGTTCSTLVVTGRGNEGFATETAKVSGKTKQDVNRSIKRANDVCQEARDLIRNTKLDTGATLDKLAKMDAAQQVEHCTESLELLRDKEARAALREEREAREREAKELRDSARDECMNFLCTMMNGRDWATLIDLVERSGGSIKSDQLRKWQAP